jgi:hypothetical protein
MDNNIIENFLNEYEKSNIQTTEYFKLQEELSRCESELIALQTRFVHK